MTVFRRIILATALSAASLSAFADKVVTYTIDSSHSFVHFSWSHVGFSNPTADFTKVTGSITGNQDHPEQSSVTVTMPVSSLDSHVPLLNEHLISSGDYFKSKEFPDVTFKSTAIKGLDRKKQTFKLQGELTVNGITRPVLLDAKLNKAGPHPFYDNAPAAGFNATTTLKRSDFGMGKYVPVVSDELKVSITVEAIEAAAYQKMLDKQKADAEKTAGK